MRYWLPVLLFVAVAFPAHADTFKWVDEKGVTNYSSTPPSAKAKPVRVEDRVSVVPTDPSWKEAAAVSAARPDYATEEWLQRQRLMALKETYSAPVYSDDYYPSYGYGYYPGYTTRRPRPAHPIVRGGAIRASFTPPAATPRPAARGTMSPR